MEGGDGVKKGLKRRKGGERGCVGKDILKRKAMGKGREKKKARKVKGMN